ncbi:MAG: DNA repair protein RecO [Magnetococcales bacterium]|nr:DNA repair protein RecO [Magnetococcales bacterium]
MRCSDDALVLRRTPFRETSLLLHFFTRQDGLLTAVARGVRAHSRSATAVDRAALAGFHTVAVSRYARSAHALATVTAVEIKHPRHRLWREAAAVLAAQVVQEILYRFMAPLEPNPAVFELLEWAWDRLDAGAKPLAVLGICQGRLVRALGYGWRTDCCAGCGRTEALGYFSAKRGQVVCDRCAAPYVGQPSWGGETQHPPHFSVPPQPPPPFFFNSFGLLNRTGGRHASRTGHRLFPLGNALHSILHHLEWTAEVDHLSQNDLATLYHIGMACLVWLGGTPLLADAPFRQMVGLTTTEPP